MIDNELEELVLLAEQRGETQEAIGKLIEEYDAKKAQDSQAGPNGESKTPGQEEEKSPSTTETTEEDTSSSAEVDPLEKYRNQQELLNKAGVGPDIDTSKIPESSDRLTGYSETKENLVSQKGKAIFDEARRLEAEDTAKPKQKEPERPQGVPPNFIPANDGTGMWVKPEIVEERLSNSANELNSQREEIAALQNHLQNADITEPIIPIGASEKQIIQLQTQYEDIVNNYNAKIDDYNIRLADYQAKTKAHESSLESYNNEVSKLKSPEVGSWESFKNSLSNTFEMGGDVLEFWDTTLFGADEVKKRAEDGTLGAYSGLDIATTLVWEGVFGREKMKDWKKNHPTFFQSFNPSDSETFAKVIESFGEEQEQTLPTMTFAEADSFGDYISVGMGSVVNVGGSVVYNLGTLGSGFFMEFAADNFIEANKIKAEQLGVDLDDLLKSGEFDSATPIKIAAVQAGLELFAVGQVTKPFKKVVNKEIGKALTKKVAYNSTARAGLDVLSTGSAEAVTEMTQYGLEYYNKELAKNPNTGMASTIVEGMFSPEGVESGLQGLIGGGGLRL